ncbi:MAG: 3'-5' exonuclease, partial [Muribaculaceae bacterium]|nr:3'-5' exonuclease [Muribaculaceae bacterium]
MELNLKKSIIFFDLETTGTNITKDRIVEISIIKVKPNGEEEEYTYRINPEMPIPAEATAVHHITDDDVRHEPTFKQRAKELAKIFMGCDIAGFNSNRFDMPLLVEEFDRAGVDFDYSKAHFIDVQTIFHKKEPRTLVAAYRYYCNKELEGAHSANADTRATLEVLKAQLDRYEDLPRDMEELAKFSSPNR